MKILINIARILYFELGIILRNYSDQLETEAEASRRVYRSLNHRNRRKGGRCELLQ